MKIFLALVFACLLITPSCTCSKQKKEVTVTAIDTLTRLPPGLDTIMIGDKVIRLVQAKAFIKSNYKMSESYHLAGDSEHVSRMGDSLRLMLEDGKSIFLINDNPDDDEDAEETVGYTYYGNFDVLNSWLVYLQYYEGMDYMLVNKTTGEKTIIYGVPLISPDKKRFVCYSFDLDADYIYNGIQLFNVENRRIKPAWERGFDLWGPEDMKWTDNNTLRVKQTWRDDKGEFTSRFMKMTLKD